MDVDPVALVGLAAGAITSGGFLPQLLRGWRTRSLVDVSPHMLGLLSVGLSLWLTYGVLRGDPTIVVANGVGLSFVLATLALWTRYGRVRVADADAPGPATASAPTSPPPPQPPQ